MNTRVRPIAPLALLALAACAKNPAGPPRTPGAEWLEHAGDPSRLALDDLVAIRMHCEPFEGFRMFRALRTDTSDVDVLRELGLRAWTVSVGPEPIRTWVEAEESGQTTASRLPGQEMAYVGAAPGGALTLWFLPGANGRMESARAKSIAAAIGGLGREPSPVPQGVGLRFAGGADSRELSIYPPVPLFWADWDAVELRGSVRAGAVAFERETTLAVLEATETAARDGRSPRRVVLRWMAEPDSSAPQPK